MFSMTCISTVCSPRSFLVFYFILSFILMVSYCESLIHCSIFASCVVGCISFPQILKLPMGRERNLSHKKAINTFHRDSELIHCFFIADYTYKFLLCIDWFYSLVVNSVLLIVNYSFCTFCKHPEVRRSTASKLFCVQYM